MVILGISLGTTTTGVAILSGGELVFWHTHSFRDRWTDDKAALIASRYERYIHQYRPRLIMVKIPPEHHHSSAIKQLLLKIKSLFAYHGCMVEYTVKEEVKAAIQVNNHHQLMKYVTEVYPILLPEYDKAVAGKNKYHTKLFDAVMAAHTGQEVLKTKAQETVGSP
ncbi:hypothetical protein JN11_03931 [Mucilaginibacter frigoritolerans]|uniref:Uncharacterized protein n=1 Tax=Mucilaginibacter frigoritolerans TaxID=652788 RepID=A0A562TU94_9SPHI|nr:hypothetical protein [Mucilaginibacter frigoritolerans]TWI96818.1 hypothetical protein JN11_03931 [Mucilaginibacter frigoritolerans]